MPLISFLRRLSRDASSLSSGVLGVGGALLALLSVVASLSILPGAASSAGGNSLYFGSLSRKCPVGPSVRSSGNSLTRSLRGFFRLE